MFYKPKSRYFNPAIQDFRNQNSSGKEHQKLFFEYELSDVEDPLKAAAEHTLLYQGKDLK